MSRLLANLVLPFIFVNIAQAAQVTIPNSFSSGGTIKSSEINANFSAVATAINAAPVVSLKDFSSPGTYTVTVPANVTKMFVEAIGGGGGAGGGACSSGSGVSGGGVGGAGAYAKGVYAVSAGDTIHVVVGAGGSGGAGNYSCGNATAGQAGSPTTVSDGATQLISAGAGTAGTAATNSSCGISPSGGSPGSTNSSTGARLVFAVSATTGAGAPGQPGPTQVGASCGGYPSPAEDGSAGGPGAVTLMFF